MIPVYRCLALTSPLLPLLTSQPVWPGGHLVTGLSLLAPFTYHLRLLLLSALITVTYAAKICGKPAVLPESGDFVTGGWPIWRLRALDRLAHGP